MVCLANIGLIIDFQLFNFGFKPINLLAEREIVLAEELVTQLFKSCNLVGESSNRLFMCLDLAVNRLNLSF